MQFLVDPNLKPYRIDIFSFALGQNRQQTHPEIDIIDNDEDLFIQEMEQLDLRSANFVYQGEIKFGSRDNNVKDDGGTKYYQQYQQLMKREENA